MEYLRQRLGRAPVAAADGSTNEFTPLEQEQHTDDEDDVNEEFDVVEDFVPIQFLENRIRTLSRTSVPHDLSRLEQHMENMTRLHGQQDWEKLHAEQLNASRSVQQLKGHLQTLDELRQQVRASDISSFDQFTDGLRENIHTAVQDYQKLTAGMREEGQVERGCGSPLDGGVAVAGGEKEEEEEEEVGGRNLQRIYRTADHYQSLEDLRSELLELNGLVQQLNSAANEHSVSVARLRRNTESATVRAHEGVNDIRGAHRFKDYVLPVGGAIVGGVLGGVVGGPVGAFAGLKVGALTATAAGTAGIVGGALVGLRVKKARAEKEANPADSASTNQANQVNADVKKES